VNSPSTGAANRWAVLTLLGVAQLMIVLDVTIVNIALPSAQRALGFSTDERQWIITAYAPTFAARRDPDPGPVLALVPVREPAVRGPRRHGRLATGGRQHGTAPGLRFLQRREPLLVRRPDQRRVHRQRRAAGIVHPHRAPREAPTAALRVVADRSRGGGYASMAVTGAALFSIFLFMTFYMQ